MVYSKRQIGFLLCVALLIVLSTVVAFKRHGTEKRDVNEPTKIRSAISLIDTAEEMYKDDVRYGRMPASEQKNSDAALAALDQGEIEWTKLYLSKSKEEKKEMLESLNYKLSSIHRESLGWSHEIQEMARALEFELTRWRAIR